MLDLGWPSLLSLPGLLLGCLASLPVFVISTLLFIVVQDFPLCWTFPLSWGRKVHHFCRNHWEILFRNWYQRSVVGDDRGHWSAFPSYLSRICRILLPNLLPCPCPHRWRDLMSLQTYPYCRNPCLYLSHVNSRTGFENVRVGMVHRRDRNHRPPDHLRDFYSWYNSIIKYFYSAWKV